MSLVAVITVFGAIQLVSLSQAFFNNQATTVVTTLRNITLEDLTLAIPTRDMEVSDMFDEALATYNTSEWLNETFPSQVHRKLLRQLIEIGDRCGYPPFYGMAINFRTATETTIEATAAEMVTAFASINTTISTVKMQHYEKIYLDILKSHVSLAANWNSVDGDNIYVDSSLQMTVNGPRFVVHLGNFSTFNTKNVELSIKRSEVFRKKGKFVLGGGTIQGSTSDGTLGRVIHPDADLDISTSISVHRKDKYYCDPDEARKQAETRLSCRNRCRVEQATVKNSCLPFGIASLSKANNSICNPLLSTNDDCVKVNQECLQKCQECVKCVLCRNLVQSFIFELSRPVVEEEYIGQQITILYANMDDITEYHNMPMYGTSAYLSQVGGILGLCFGMSILSIGQVMMLCMTAAKHLLFDNGERTQTRSLSI